ncbi:MAG: hypothetical protein Q4C04_06400 [Clostridia bacterium]|nr:hypothetical protein [Clostridia bacterium]
MKRYEPDKRILGMLITSLMFYLLAIVVVAVLIVLRGVIDNNLPVTIGFGVAFIALVYMGIRALRMYLAAKSAYLEYDETVVNGTTNSSPKSKANRAFSINRSEILSVAANETDMNKRASFQTLVINARSGSYHCFGIGEAEIKTAVRELSPPQEDEDIY